MRMWNVKPELMCTRHLLGEHVEMHMFAGCLANGKSIDGYIRKGLVEVHNIAKRHDDLARELKMRGFKHVSPLKKFNYYVAGKVGVKKSLKELSKRCIKCRRRQENDEMQTV